MPHHRALLRINCRSRAAVTPGSNFRRFERPFAERRSAVRHHAPASTRTGAARYAAEPFSAVTSISIFIAGSASPAWIIIAAGFAEANASRIAGQHCSKSAPSGST